MGIFKRNYSRFVFILILILGVSGFFSKESNPLEERGNTFSQENGLVIAVYDGDTIKVRFKDNREKKVRLIGINAPEIDAPGEERKFQAYMAKRFTFYYLYNKKIRLSYDWEPEDKYGRVLAYIWTEKEGLFNKFILSEGFASAFLKFPFKYKKEFIGAEREAKRLKKGLWKKRSYPLISEQEARENVGRLLTVKYTCVKIQTGRKFVFLHSSGKEFSALIPREKLSQFPKIRSFKGKVLLATGFLEEYKGKPQIVIFFPIQIEIGKK